ncbi:MAG: pyridoxamine 5'-phosphate oxidase family protein, partial [Candidatus Binatia bacterium]
VRREFLASLRFVIVGGLDSAGRLWATARFGEPGFLHVVGDAAIRIEGRAPLADPLAGSLSPGAPIGLVALELSARHRLRINGTVVESDDSGLTIATGEVFGNCPKYIQRRAVRGVASGGAGGGMVSTALGEDARRMIEEADTFFLATRHAERGVDVSHRGGQPGFVRVTSPRTLEWPDYSGNGMFLTLGNLAGDPSAGILVVDFESGRTLHLTGSAIVDWSPERAAAHAGAERVVAFELDEARELVSGSPLRFDFLDESPFNPR